MAGLSHMTALDCANKPTLEEPWSGMQGLPGLGGHVQQGTMFQWGVHCLLISAPPLGEGD